MELLNGLIGVLILFKEIAEWMADRPALCIAIFAVAISLYSIHRSMRMAQYTYLANIWFKIKDKGFKRHDFIDPNKTTAYKTYFTGNRLTDYNIFAYMCWAHAEDIYLNRWHRKWYGRGSACYTSTIQDFKKRHYKWLRQPNNSRDFDSHFKKYIEKLHLFSVDAKEIKDELNKVQWNKEEQVSYALKDEFKNEEFSLPDNTPITRVKKKEWEITTVLENSQKTLKEYAHKVTSSVTFIIRKKYGKLNIYNEFGEEKNNEL
jgi:hypothetical protein